MIFLVNYICKVEMGSRDYAVEVILEALGPMPVDVLEGQKG